MFKNCLGMTYMQKYIYICRQYFTSFSKTFFPRFPKYPHLIKTRFPNQKLSSLSSGITCFTNLSFFIIREKKGKKRNHQVQWMERENYPRVLQKRIWLNTSAADIMCVTFSPWMTRRRKIFCHYLSKFFQNKCPLTWKKCIFL